jgi:hypothetical protein
VRRLILQTGISIDGYVAALDGSHPWGYAAPDEGAKRCAGLPLFKDLAAPLHLELVEATTYPTGVAIHVYRPRTVPAGQPVDPDQPEQVG